MCANRRNSRVLKKSGSRNTMVMSNFSPEVEIRPFRACAMKICNIALIYGRIAEIFASFRKSESGNTMVTSDFFTGSGNTAVLRMRNASGHNYWNSSFIMG